MRIITEKALKDAGKVYGCESEIDTFVTLLRSIEPKNLEELKKTFSSAEAVGKTTVINFKGNHYRVISAIHYNKNLIHIMEVMTHADYSKNKWQKKYKVFG